MKWLAVLFGLFIVTIIILADANLLGPLRAVYNFPYGDKAGHFVLYGLLAFVLDLAFLERPHADLKRRILIIALVLAAGSDLAHTSSASGLAYAVASGAIASGMGYAVWYTVLPNMTRISAAFVQLTVPAIAAVGGVLFIGEPLSGRLLISSAGILGGVALALFAANLRRARAQQL